MNKQEQGQQDELLLLLNQGRFKELVVAPRFKEKWWTEPLNSRFENIKYFKHNEIFNVNNYLKLQINFSSIPLHGTISAIYGL